MKKVISGILVLVLSLSIVACAEKEQIEKEPGKIKTATITENEDGHLYAEYAIKNGEIVLGREIENSGGIDKEHKIIWKKIKIIIPKKYMKMISKYEVVTDGLDGVLASVSLNEDYKTWTISMDLKDTLDENQNFTETSITTLIHEMSHIIALNYSQMGGDPQDKTLYTVEEGTLKKDSYLNVFYDKFWKNHMSEHSKNSEEENADSYNDHSFYNKYKDEFVTDYAATNPVEDFAESFAFFVVREKPTDNSIMSQKLLFFYDYPELVAIRDDIRRKIDINKIREKTMMLY